MVRLVKCSCVQHQDNKSLVLLVAVTGRRSSFSFFLWTQTSTNMATAEARMLSALLCGLYLLLLAAPGAQPSSLHIQPDHRRGLPLDTGFYTVQAHGDLPYGEGGGAAAAPAPSLAARSAARGGHSSGVSPEHRRSRRSVGEAAMPKVYGQVMRQHTLTLAGVHLIRYLLFSWSSHGSVLQVNYCLWPV